MGKVTMKEKVLQFVESKGSASFTEIQRFIVDHNFGEGTYAKGYIVEDTYVMNKETETWEKRSRKMNTNRGYYSSAFYKGHETCPWSNRKDGYFLRGNDRLHKVNNPMNPKHGKYIVIRNNELNMSI